MITIIKFSVDNQSIISTTKKIALVFITFLFLLFTACSNSGNGFTDNEEGNTTNDANNPNNNTSKKDGSKVRSTPPVNTASIYDNTDLKLNGANAATAARIDDNTYLFVAGNDDNGVSIFRIANNGSLINRDNISDDGSLNLSGASSIVTAKIGNKTYLFVTGQNDDGISVFDLSDNNSTSNITNVKDNAILELDGANSITTATIGSKTFLFVAGLLDDGVSVFDVSADGGLTNRDNTSDNNTLEIRGASSVTTAQVGSKTFLFVAGLLDDGVSVFEVSENGMLTNRDNVSDNRVFEIKGASSVATAQVGNKTYLFVAGRDDDGVSVFEVTENGVLINRDNVKDSEDNDYNLDSANSVATAEIGSSTYLYVAGIKDDGVSIFEVAEDGTLSNQDNIKDNYDLELDGASSVAVEQIGGNTYLFVTGKYDDGVSVFQTDRPNNNGFSKARKIRLGNTYSDNFVAVHQGLDERYYQIYLFAGRYTIDTYSNIDTLCELYSVNNTNHRLAYNDDSGTRNNCSIDYSITQAGYYYIKVSGYNSATIGNYILRIHITSPDIQISSFSASQSYGGNLILSSSISNKGMGNSPPTNLHYYRSIDRIIDENDTLIATESLSSLSVRESVTETITVTGHNSGVRYYGVCASVVEGEVSIENNCSIGAPIAALPPDISIVSFEANSRYISSGDSIVLSTRVENSVGIYSSPTTIRYYKSIDNIISSKDTLIATDSLGSLFAGGYANKTITVTGHNSGNMFYGACVDTVIEEVRIDNNCSSGVVVESFSFFNVSNISDTAHLELKKAISVATTTIKNKTYLFVAGNDDNGFSVFKVAEDGKLINTANVSDNATFNLDGASSITTAKIGSKNFVFVVGKHDNGFSVFEVLEGGTLINTANISDNAIFNLDRASDVTTKQIGSKTFLFVSSQSDNGISVFEVAADGTLTNVDNTSDNNILELDGASSVTTAQVGNKVFLFATGEVDDGISVFEVSESGKLANRYNISDKDDLELRGAISVTTKLIGDKTFLFVAGKNDNGISVFEVASDGKLINRDNVSDGGDLELDGASSITVNTIGSKTFLFVAVKDDDGISIFEVTQQGTLSNRYNIRDNADLEINGAISVASSQTYGKTFLFVAGSDDDGVSVFQMEKPHNNSFKKARELKLGNDYSDNLAFIQNGKKDNRYYKIYLFAGQYTISTYSNIDTFCELYSGDQNLLDKNDDGGLLSNCSITYNITTNGYYYILVRGFNSTTIGNYALQILSVSPPDLIPFLSPRPTTIGSKDDITLKATIQNQGKGSSVTTTIRYYRSTDSIINANDTQIAIDNIPSVTAGGFRNKSTVITGHISGTSYYGVCVDSVVGETSTDNNCSKGIAVEVFSFSNVDNTKDNENLNLDGARNVAIARIGEKTYLFVAGYWDNGVSVFEVTANGRFINKDNVSDEGDLKLNRSSSAITTKIGNKTFLFVAGYWDNGVSVFEVSQQGTLINRSNISDNATLQLRGAHSVTTAAIGNETYLFVAGKGDDGVSVFEIAGDGTLTNRDNTSDNATLKINGATSISTAQVGSKTFLFVAGDHDNGISVFEVALDGTLTNIYNIQDSENLQLNRVFSVSTAQIGSKTMLFVGSQGDDGISVFEVLENGSLKNLWNISDNADLKLNDLFSITTAEVGNQTLLFASGAIDDGMSIFEISNEGTLTNIGNVSDTGELKLIGDTREGGDLKLDGAISISTAQIGGKTFVFVVGYHDFGVSVFQMDGAGNNSFQNAKQIRLGQNYSDRLKVVNSGFDNHYYRVYLYAGQYSISTNSDIDTYCYLYGDRDTNNHLAQDDDSGTGDNCSIAYNITTAGYYYIRVHGASSNTAGNYTLQIRR